MCAAAHARPSFHRTDRATTAVFFWLSYAHGLGRAALGTGGEAGRLYFVYGRWYFAKKIGGPCMQCIMQPTSSVVVEYSYDTMEGPQISKCGPSDVSFRTEQSYVLETTTRAAAVDHNAMHVLTDTGTAVKGVPKVRHILYTHSWSQLLVPKQSARYTSTRLNPTKGYLIHTTFNDMYVPGTWYVAVSSSYLVLAGTWYIRTATPLPHIYTSNASWLSYAHT